MKLIHTDMGDIYTWDKLTPEMVEVRSISVAELEKLRAQNAELQSQNAALQAHHRNMREHWQRLYATVIVRALKAERDAAKWHGIAIGAIEEVTE